MPLAGELPILLHLHGSTCQGSAVAEPSEAVPGENWGQGATAPSVLGATIPPGRGRRLSAEKLVELGTGNARLLWPGSVLDGPANGFGKRFWDWLAREAPLEIGAMRSAGVAALHASDRYLLQAYTVRCLSDVLRAAPGAKDARVSVDIAPDERPPSDPRFVHHNFPSGGIRKEVLQSLLPGAEVTLSPKVQIPHYRAIRAELNDGRRVEILLDQGFGAWRATRSPRLDLHQSAAALARNLSSCDYGLSADTPSVPVAVTMLRGDTPDSRPDRCWKRSVEAAERRCLRFAQHWLPRGCPLWFVRVRSPDVAGPVHRMVLANNVGPLLGYVHRRRTRP